MDAVSRLALRHTELMGLCYRWYRAGALETDIDAGVAEWCDRAGLVAAFRGFADYPAHMCASADDALMHGIPRAVRADDCRIFGCDVGLSDGRTTLDAAWSACGSRATEEDRRLVDRSFASLAAAVKAVRTGATVGDVGWATETAARPFSVCRGWYGHGVGPSLHEPPDIPLHGPPGVGPRLRAGALVAVEPMLSAGDGRTAVAEDGWTVRAADGAMTAHQETSVLVGDPSRALVRWWESIPPRELLRAM